MSTQLPTLTHEQAKLLAWFLCDPFLTVDECLRLVGVNQSVIEEETEKEKLAA